MGTCPVSGISISTFPIEMPTIKIVNRYDFISTAFLFL
jgi:hypothetical protein